MSMMYLAGLVIVALFLHAILDGVRVGFYRAYFNRKQRNAGRDPQMVLREQFPILWRWM